MWDTRTCFTYAYSAGTYADYYQAITANAVSTNTLDLDAAGLAIAGGSKPPWLVARVGTASDAAVSIEIKLVTATAADLTTGQKQLKLFRFQGGGGTSQMTAGALLINEPLGHFKYQRYLGIEFTTFTDDTTLTIAVGLNDGPEFAVTDIDLVEAGS